MPSTTSESCWPTSFEWGFETQVLTIRSKPGAYGYSQRTS